MLHMTEPPRIPGAGPVVGQVETDRYCDECGFNLRTQPVFRDERSGVLMMRCTECGRFHAAALLTTASQNLFRRAGSLMVVIWMLLFVWLMVMTGIGLVAMQFATLDELTQGRGNRIAPKADFDGYRTYMLLMLGGSATLTFVQGLLQTCICYHWPRWVYYLTAVLIPLIPLSIVYYGWREQAPALVQWALPFQIGHYIAQVFGGTMAAMFGRSFFRLMATILLPPRSRVVLGHLWLIDGHTIPAMNASRLNGPTV